MTIFQGEYNPSQLGVSRIGIVVSRFNEPISQALLAGAARGLEQHGVKQVDTFWVPGAFDIVPVLKKLVDSYHYQAIICLGTVIRGETPHFEYVAGEAAKGIAQVAGDAEIPIIFGVLTTDTVEQAWARAGVKLGNKGFESALAALELASLYQKLPRSKQ